jgi:hypothetical protein
VALIAGGNWNNGVNAGARSVNLNNYPWNVNTNIGARAACDYCYFRRVALRSGGTTNFYISQSGLPDRTAANQKTTRPVSSESEQGPQGRMA